MIGNSITISTMTSARVKLDSCTIGISGFMESFLLLPSLSITYDTNTLMSIDIVTRFPARVSAGTLVLFTIPP